MHSDMVSAVSSNPSLSTENRWSRELLELLQGPGPHRHGPVETGAQLV
jgi:hypothetical protein